MVVLGGRDVSATGQGGRGTVRRGSSGAGEEGDPTDWVLDPTHWVSDPTLPDPRLVTGTRHRDLGNLG